MAESPKTHAAILVVEDYFFGKRTSHHLQELVQSARILSADNAEEAIQKLTAHEGKLHAVFVGSLSRSGGTDAAAGLIRHMRAQGFNGPIMADPRIDTHVAKLREAGCSHVYDGASRRWPASPQLHAARQILALCDGQATS